MIKKYKDFINEKLSVFGDMKNLAGKFLHSTSDDAKKPVELFLNQLNNSKDIDLMKKQFLNYLKSHNESLKTSLKDTDDIENIKNITKDNLSTIYISLKSIITFINDKEQTISNIFKESNENIKKLFTDDEKVFDKNINSFNELLISDLAKPLNINTDKGEKDDELNDILIDVDKDLNNDKNDVKSKEIDEKIIKLKDNILKWFQYNIYQTIKNKMDL